jgi:hypothetical protein
MYRKNANRLRHETMKHQAIAQYINNIIAQLYPEYDVTTCYESKLNIFEFENYRTIISTKEENVRSFTSIKMIINNITIAISHNGKTARLNHKTIMDHDKTFKTIKHLCHPNE